MLKFIKRLFIFLISLILLFIIGIFAARFITSKQIAINTEKGIESKEYWDINGIKQYIQIRGQNKDNKIILFLHGGPGSPHAFISHTYQKELEENFTFINWDQRGSGRTYFANKEKNPVSIDMLYSDLEALIDEILSRYSQDKLILMGHSWGTIIGSKYAMNHPDKLHAYIGVGQVWNSLEGEKLATEKAIEAANNNGETTDATKIKELYDKNINDLKNGKLSLKDFSEYRSMTTGKYLASKSSIPFLKSIALGATSPNMEIDDLRWFLINSTDIETFENIYKDTLLKVFNFSIVNPKIDVPVAIIMGDEDWITPTALSEKYFDTIQSPSKKLYIIDNAGHAPYFDNTKDFTKAVEEFLQILDK